HGIDGMTRSEVEALMAFDPRSTDSLEKDIGEVVGQVARQTLEQLEPRDMRCGAYQLGDLLGRGGMGAVYSAERVDGEVAQRVAVKLLRPGADTRQLRQRFLAERQILATLSHPNIARLLDAGHCEDGQPYLVMEYVEGKPIDVYTAGLDIRHKVALFLKVCAAVGYLHRNLVVHRDLKPANILVTAEGEAKLLDFGIAKMLDLTTDFTMTSMRMLTPDYASPEQVAGGAMSTATDVYSLGAVLYKLLTGVSPHQFEGDSAGAISLAISMGKIAPPSSLAASLKGDLETILMKALRKQPQERYATIEQFSEDLENYLEARPIRARKGEAWYQTRKFLRRHWLPVAAATLAIASLAGGVLLADRQRTIAQQRFVQVRQLSNKLFDIDAEVRRIPGATKARQLIVDTSLEYLRRLSADVQGDSELALEVGNAYLRVARVQGVPISSNLGQMDQAAENLRTAEKFIQSVLASQPDNRTALLRSAQIAHDQMLLARFGSRYQEALALAKKSAERLEKFHAGSDDKFEAAAILVMYLNVADQLMLGRQFDDALRLCRRGSELARSYNNQAYLGTLLWVSAEVFRSQGDLDKALKDVRESVRVLELAARSADQGPTMNFMLALIYQARILGQDNSINLGRREEAVATLDRAFRMADSIVHQDPNDQASRGRLAMAGVALADILRHSAPGRSLTIYDHILRHMAEIKNNSGFRRFEVSALAGSSYPLRRLGRTAEARQRLDAAFALLRQIKAYPAEKVKPGSEADVALCALADYEADNGYLPAAIATYERLLAKMQAWQPKPETSLADAVDLARVYAALAALRRRAHQTSLASPLESRRLELWQRWDRKLTNNAFVRRQLEAAREKITISRRTLTYFPARLRN
ncbi:MAG TPA: serine/threonine-protein kinase, partial [Bryobacteraceae bacterium]|nr:serine/threonine-protein kinase [Bryobacteraceae bacterium]